MTSSDFPIVVEIKGNRFEISSEEWNRFSFHRINEDLFSVSLEDKTFRIKLLDFDLAKGMCSISIDGQIKEIKVLRDIDIMIEKMGLNISHSKKQDVVMAPMPGLVTQIKVVEKQAIQKGDPVLILEAMKMENVISAPHDAVIANIKVNVGQAVDKGFPLIEFE